MNNSNSNMLEKAKHLKITERSNLSQEFGTGVGGNLNVSSQIITITVPGIEDNQTTNVELMVEQRGGTNKITGEEKWNKPIVKLVKNNLQTGGAKKADKTKKGPKNQK